MKKITVSGISPLFSDSCGLIAGEQEHEGPPCLSEEIMDAEQGDSVARICPCFEGVNRDGSIMCAIDECEVHDE